MSNLSVYWQIAPSCSSLSVFLVDARVIFEALPFPPPRLYKWSLDYGVGVFHEFLLINFVRDELMQGEELWPLDRSIEPMSFGWNFS